MVLLIILDFVNDTICICHVSELPYLYSKIIMTIVNLYYLGNYNGSYELHWHAKFSSKKSCKIPNELEFEE